MKKIGIAKILLTASLVFSGISLVGITASNNKVVESHAYTPSTTYTNGDASTYYSGISTSATGTTLLSALQSLNSNKRKTTVGYSTMGTTPSGAFCYTDYDPSSTTTDSNGQVYGTKLTTFYSGGSATSGMNREHVWPNSHGGSLVEADIHMPRPTLQAENGSRGNSFYVEGKCDSSAGWDPAMESFGDETYRGDSARIIFYCVVANSNLSLIEADSHSTSNSNKDNMMGKLSDLLKWNINYPVLQREKNRNEGAEYLQGNRNPFIDHPEYACKIWGSTNATTQAICANDTSGASELTKLTMSETTTTLQMGATLQLSVTPTPSDASDSVTWTSSVPSVATVDANGLVTANSTTTGYTLITATSTTNSAVKAYCNLTVIEPTETAITSVSAADITVAEDGSSTIAPTCQPSDAWPVPTYSYSSADTSIATVSSAGVVTGVKAGSTTVTVTASQTTGTTKTCTVNVTVTDNPTGGTWYKASSIKAGDQIIFANTSKSAVACGIADSGGYLTADTSATFNSTAGTITNLPADTSVFTVGGSSGAWTFTNLSGGVLGTTAAKAVNVIGNGTTTWDVTISSSSSSITSTNSSYGSLYYNTSSPRFTTYTAAQGIVYIYKNYQDSGSTTTEDTVSLSPTTLSLTVGDTSTLTPTASGTVTWSTSNSSVATVLNGVVTAVAAGTATITATCGTAKATCAVTVTAAATDPSTDILTTKGTQESPFSVADARAFVDLNGQSTTINSYYVTGIISEIVTAYSSSYGNITFNLVDQTGDTDIFQGFRIAVNSTQGNALVVGATVVIYAQLTYYSSKTLYETVAAGSLISYTIPAVESSLSLDINSATIKVGATKQITATTTGDGTLAYASSDTTIATVSSSGLITGVAEGNATITVTFDDKSAQVAVTVIAASSGGDSGSTDGATYDLTFTNSSDGSAELDSSGITDLISTGADYVSSFSSISKVYAGSTGLKFGSSKAVGTLTLNASSTLSALTVTKLTVATAQYGSDTGTFQVSVNGGTATSVTPSAGTTDITLDNVSITSITIATSAKRAYLSGLSFTVAGSGSGETSYTADDFASDFLTAVSCDATGTNAPTLSKTWAELATLYGNISTDTEKAKLVSASYTVTGSGASTVVTASGDTTNTVAQAMYRYDYIISKYGTTTYTAFITSRTPLVTNTDMFKNVNNNTLPIVVVSSILSITCLLGYVCLRRKED